MEIKQKQNFNEIDSKVISFLKSIKCPECNGQTIYDAETKTAEQIREEVIQMHNEGKEFEKIKLHISEKYSKELFFEGKDGLSGIIIWSIILMACVFLGIALKLKYRKNLNL